MNSNYPKGIYNIFLTEMWERFSYYGITALLILYMDKTFAVDKEHIYAIFGAYGALVYMTPLLGGFLADKYIGNYNAVIIGGIFIAVGHFIVALEYTSYFYLGLAVIIAGTGLFTPNINTIIGHLYAKNSQERDKGFTLAYMGRNIGTIAAPIVCAWIAAVYDWRYAFVAAGIGMIIGLITFQKGRRFYNQASFKSRLSQQTIIGVTIAIIMGTGFIFYIMQTHINWIGRLLLITVGLMLLSIIYLASKEEKNTRTRILIAVILTMFYVVFMILLQQSGGALNLFTDKFVDRQIWGVTIETAMYQAVEPFFLVMLAPIYNIFWTFLAKKQYNMSYGFKFMLALIIMSTSFILMAIAVTTANPQGLINMQWINLTYLLQAASELFIGPIGLAMISQLIPNKILGFFMGFWVLAAAIANFLAAKIGYIITPSDSILVHSTKLEAIALYTNSFWNLAYLGITTALLLAFMIPFINRYYTKLH